MRRDSRIHHVPVALATVVALLALGAPAARADQDESSTEAVEKPDPWAVLGMLERIKIGDTGR